MATKELQVGTSSNVRDVALSDVLVVDGDLYFGTDTTAYGTVKSIKPSTTTYTTKYENDDGVMYLVEGSTKTKQGKKTLFTTTLPQNGRWFVYINGTLKGSGATSYNLYINDTIVDSSYCTDSAVQGFNTFKVISGNSVNFLLYHNEGWSSTSTLVITEAKAVYLGPAF